MISSNRILKYFFDNTETNIKDIGMNAAYTVKVTPDKSMRLTSIEVVLGYLYPNHKRCFNAPC